MSNPLFRGMLKSAWPAPSIDNLLRTITVADLARAAAAWRDFEAGADFDKLTRGEFRLISLAARRLAELASDSQMRPRIFGIERSIWTRSQMVIREAATGLRKLSDANVEMLIIKGAGRAASGEAVARGRIVNDIDIVVHPEEIERAFNILVADGWTPAGSGSPLYHCSRLSDVTGINLVRGEHGNIDLHRTPFHAPFDCAGEDASIWQRSLPGTLGNTPVRIPSPLDTIVIAIAHGSLDAHKNSDWLADIAASIDKGVDWDLFPDIARRRRLRTAAAIALGYSSERLECPVPAEIIESLENAALRNPVKLLATVAEARPKSNSFGLFWLARAVTKQSRLFRVGRRTTKQSRLVLASPFRRPVSALPDGEFALSQDLALPARENGAAWTGIVELEVMTQLAPASRRVEFEVNTREHHLLRLRAIVRNRGHRHLSLRFRMELAVPAGDSEPVM